MDKIESSKEKKESKDLKEAFLNSLEEQIEKNSETKSLKSSFIKRERYIILLAILCQFIWSIGVILMKYASQREKYTPNNYSMWRSFFMSTITSISLKKTGKKLNEISKINKKGWFIIRTCGVYFGFLFFLISLSYLRAATTSCLSSSNPFIIIILSIIILKEPFYLRYLFGIIICFIGSCMILLNDKRNDDSFKNEKKDFKIGLFFIIIHIILLGFIIFAQKICVMDGITSETQVFYIGISNFCFGIFFCFFEKNFGFDFIVILMTFLNAIVFFFAQKVNDIVFRYMDVSKFAPTSYIQTLFVFILCGIIFKEKFFFSDIIGSFFIASIHFYNAYDPIKSKNIVR